MDGLLLLGQCQVIAALHVSCWHESPADALSFTDTSAGTRWLSGRTCANLAPGRKFWHIHS